MPPVTQARYQAVNATLFFLIKKQKKNPKRTQPTLFLKIDAQHPPASGDLTFHIPDFLKMNDFHPDLASSSSVYVFVLLECSLEPVGEEFYLKYRYFSLRLSCLLWQLIDLGDLPLGKKLEGGVGG